MIRWPLFVAVPVLILFITAGWVTRDLEADQERVCREGHGKRPDGKSFDPGREPRPSADPVKLIEFTDQGELADRCQWSDFLLEIRNISAPVYVLLYVHGWKHDGRSVDDDLKHFKDVVAGLQKKVPEDAHVVGGFVAWPGRSGISPIDETLGFWSRKTASDRVSISGNVAKLLGAVNSVRRFRQEPRDMVVGIGHSFGARILFSSAAYAILHDSQMKHPGTRGGTYGRISGATDLIILLNPAFEASRYTSVDSLRRPLEKFELGQQPVMLTISTTNDYATRFAFPLGQTLSGRWHERERTTVGNYGDFVTHELRHISLPERREPQQLWWFDEFCHSSICLRRTTESNSAPNFGNPFIVAQTDASIVKGHNDIWAPSFIEWMTAFVAKTNEGLVAERKLQGGGNGTQGLGPPIAPEMGLAPTRAHPLHDE